MRTLPWTIRSIRSLGSTLLLLGVLVAGMANSAHGQCGLDGETYFFLHPLFKNENWSASLRDVDVRLSQKMCDLNPLRITMGARADTTMASFQSIILLSPSPAAWRHRSLPSVRV